MQIERISAFQVENFSALALANGNDCVCYRMAGEQCAVRLKFVVYKEMSLARRAPLCTCFVAMCAFY